MEHRVLLKTFMNDVSSRAQPDWVDSGVVICEQQRLLQGLQFEPKVLLYRNKVFQTLSSKCFQS
jgi:hypothetical protein